jgi:hypothetical protein
MWSGSVLASPTSNASVLFEWYQYALIAVLTHREENPNWAESVPAAMLDLGLIDVDVETYSRSWPGGSPGAKMHGVLIAELYAQLVAADMSPDDLAELQALFANPDFLLLGNTAVSVIGRRPSKAGAKTS